MSDNNININTPEIGPYTHLRPFRFWCQKVLPLVYDESLSYYELLCKVVDYLNKTMEDVDQMITDMGEFKAADTEFKTEVRDAYIAFSREVSQAVEGLETFVNNYFNNLNVQTEINNKLDAMAEAGYFTTLFTTLFTDDIIAEAGEVTSNWIAANLLQETGYVIDKSLTIENAAADAYYAGLSDELERLSNNQNILAQYLYKKDTYINNQTETTLSGYDTYRIPCDKAKAILLNWDTANPFYNALGLSHILKFYDSVNGYTAIGLNSSTANYFVSSANGRGMIIPPAGADYVSISIYGDRLNTLNVMINKPQPDILTNGVISLENTPYVIDQYTAIKSIFYTNTLEEITTLAPGGGSSAYTKYAHKDDKIIFAKLPTGFSYYGTYRISDAECERITNATFVVPNDCVLHLFEVDADPGNITYIPANSCLINWNQIINIPSSEGAYHNLKGVAFGTSLTYRSQTTGGFLTTLEELSGIDFDNQGLGSSTILTHDGIPDMMTKITNYASWADKDICLLEGFVNDWYYNGAQLGNYKDTVTTTVCGCVRYALDHILTQNPNLTVFLILDHFGSGITAPLALNSAGATQLDFYLEIEKVALSMGIRVIREYELSEISELTPQYLLDNIHLNELGAEQSGYAIWSGMKATYPNIN